MNTDDVRLARRMERRVLRFIREEHLLEAGGSVLVAVSGGQDSLALLHVLAQVRPRLDVTLTAAYVDHGMRAAAVVEAERRFVEAQAKAVDVLFVEGLVERDAGSGRRRSPEETARRGRYAALARLARAAGAGSVATGHTRNDQAETVLLRVLRGSGLRGLAAMAPASPWPVPDGEALRLVRPLLPLGREETAAYCRALGLTPRVDATNADRRYLRNRVRLEVLPALRAINPRVEEALAALADEARGWRSGVEVQLVGAEEKDGGATLSVTELRSLPRPHRMASLRAALVQVFGDVVPSRAHLLALERLALREGGAEVHLPEGLVARRAGEVLTVGPPTAEPALLEDDVAVPVPGRVKLPGWIVSTSLVQCVSAEEQGPWTVMLDPDAVVGLSVGRRRPGDRIELAGMHGRRRLQDLMVDEKVPRDERDARPVFRAARGVAWVAGLRVAAWARARGGTAVRVTVERAPGEAWRRL